MSFLPFENNTYSMRLDARYHLFIWLLDN